MRKIALLLLALSLFIVPVNAASLSSVKVIPTRTIWTVNSKKAAITGRASCAGGQLIVLYNLAGKPIDYKKLPNTGRAANFSLFASNLKQGKSAIFYIKSLKSKNTKASPAKAIVITYSTPEGDLKKWYAAMEKQYAWSKNQTYYWTKPTIKSSKTLGTCITFPSVSLQRLGMLPSGGCVYYSPTTNKIDDDPNGWFAKHPQWFDVSYPHKTIKQLGKKLKKGDIVSYGNPYYHTMVYMGKNKKGEPIFNTMGSRRGLGITYPLYANRKIDMIVHIKRVK